MQNVSTFLTELTRAVGGKPVDMRALIQAVSGQKITAPMVSMWKRRGIPWPLHDPMRQVCAQVGLPADPKVWRTIDESMVPPPPTSQEGKRGSPKVAA